ncbi:MAG: T9SS type A sorting domain-containing protein [Sphingobacteriales bacterium JAD_PAG50586_3]|nr:MAG: T9SS type A sorting domain-containing protein [Sphingobacteriales bacterium JAD_PAG50586_3]
MKRLLLIIAFGFCTYINKAQTYVPFPTSTDNAVWNISSSSHEGTCRFYDLFITGDTTIHNKSYVKLGFRGIIYLWNPDMEPWCSGVAPAYSFSTKRYAYREDSTHKIYFRSISHPIYDTTEFLLFDFGMQVGDSLKGYFSQQNFGIIPIVSSIDSIQIDNNWRKKFNFKNGFDTLEGCFYLIEGIGTNMGFLDIQGCPFFESSTTLNCFKRYEVVIWNNSNSSCSDYSFINSNKENLLNNLHIAIYPNPAQDFVNIELPQSYNQASLNIYNLTGQLISQKPITSTQIPIAELGNGMYIFVIQNGDKVIGRQRVVVVAR